MIRGFTLNKENRAHKVCGHSCKVKFYEIMYSRQVRLFQEMAEMILLMNFCQKSESVSLIAQIEVYEIIIRLSCNFTRYETGPDKAEITPGSHLYP